MGLDQLGVLTVGTLVPKEGGHTLLHSTLLVIPPWNRKLPRSQGHTLRAYPMQPVAKEARKRKRCKSVGSTHSKSFHAKTVFKLIKHVSLRLENPERKLIQFLEGGATRAKTYLIISCDCWP